MKIEEFKSFSKHAGLLTQVAQNWKPLALMSAGALGLAATQRGVENMTMAEKIRAQERAARRAQKGGHY